MRPGTSQQNNRGAPVNKIALLILTAAAVWSTQPAAQGHISAMQEYPLVYRIYDLSTPVEVLVAEGSVKLLEGRRQRVERLWEARLGGENEERPETAFTTGVVLDLRAEGRDFDGDRRPDGVELSVDGRLRTYQGMRRTGSPAGEDQGYVVMPVVREEEFKQSSHRSLQDPDPVSFTVSGSDGQRYRIELKLGLVQQ